MTLNDALQNIGNGLAWLIGFPLVAFMVVYGKWSPWRADPLGIERMFKTGYLLLLWLVIMAGNFLSDDFETLRLVARIIVFALVSAGFTVQIINLRRVQTYSPKPLFFEWLTYRAQRARRLKRQK
jgi:hypothetical protein